MRKQLENDFASVLYMLCVSVTISNHLTSRKPRKSSLH